MGFDPRVTESRDFKINALRMQGISSFYAGRFEDARGFIERLLEMPNDGDISLFQFDQFVSARTFLAEILWLQGSPDQAMALATRNVGYALTLDHAATLCYSLAYGACPVSWYSGDLEAFDRFVCLLEEASSEKGLEAWHRMGLCYRGILKLEKGDATGAIQLREALASMTQGRISSGFSLAVSRFALALLHEGRQQEAEFILDDTLAKARESGEGWCVPEILRIKGVILAKRYVETSEALLEDAFAIARKQGALGWQLRAATSLAQVQEDNDLPPRALPLLRNVIGVFKEGFQTTDYAKAASLIQSHSGCEARAGSFRKRPVQNDRFSTRSQSRFGIEHRLNGSGGAEFPCRLP